MRCVAVECKYFSEDSCTLSDIIIKPLTMPSEEGREVIIAFVCGEGTSDLYREIENDTYREQLQLL